MPYWYLLINRIWQFSAFSILVGCFFTRSLVIWVARKTFPIDVQDLVLMKVCYIVRFRNYYTTLKYMKFKGYHFSWNRASAFLLLVSSLLKMVNSWHHFSHFRYPIFNIRPSCWQTARLEFSRSTSYCVCDHWSSPQILSRRSNDIGDWGIPKYIELLHWTGKTK